ncbi:type II secretion system protein [bacterium CPR1]|nr:type II secretion system protein [bacterium CPR1]
MRCKRRGYGLMESVISLSIASMLVTALTTVVPGALLANLKARDSYRAAALAQSLLEQRQGVPFSELRGSMQLRETVDGHQFQARVEVVPIEGYDVSLLKTVRVELQWREMGRQRRLSREVRVANDET